jgi:hypothetical protein
MRAYTTTITSTPRPKAWLSVAALVLAVCSLVIPSTAAAQSSVNSITGGSQHSSQPVGDSDYTSANSITGGSQHSSQPVGDSDYTSANSIVGGSSASSQPVGSPKVDPGYSTLNAITGTPSSEPTLVAANSDDGFDWLSAAIGAASAMALVALGGAAFLSVRRRAAVSPSPASTS